MLGFKTEEKDFNVDSSKQNKQSGTGLARAGVVK